MRVVGKPEVIQLDEKSPMLRLARPALQRLLPPGRAAFTMCYGVLILAIGRKRSSGRSRYTNLPQNTHLRIFIQVRNG